MVNKITVESIHIIYKNLIRIGKELDVDRFKSFFLSKGFKQNERVIPTPTGPLKEYLLIDPENMRDLVVCSVRGFVVDAKDVENAKRLMGLAYESFEEIYGDLFSNLVLDIQVIVNMIVYFKDGFGLISKAFNNTALESLGSTIGEKKIRPKSIGFNWGSKESLKGETSAILSPLKGPNNQFIRDRLSITLEHLNQDPDAGADFVNNIEKLVSKVIIGLNRLK